MFIFSILKIEKTSKVIVFFTINVSLDFQLGDPFQKLCFGTISRKKITIPCVHAGRYISKSCGFYPTGIHKPNYKIMLLTSQSLRCGYF